MAPKVPKLQGTVGTELGQIPQVSMNMPGNMAAPMPNPGEALGNMANKVFQQQFELANKAKVNAGVAKFGQAADEVLAELLQTQGESAIGVEKTGQERLGQLAKEILAKDMQSDHQRSGFQAEIQKELRRAQNALTRHSAGQAQKLAVDNSRAALERIQERASTAADDEEFELELQGVQEKAEELVQLLGLTGDRAEAVRSKQYAEAASEAAYRRVWSQMAEDPLRASETFDKYKDIIHTKHHRPLSREIRRQRDRSWAQGEVGSMVEIFGRNNLDDVYRAAEKLSSDETPDRRHALYSELDRIRVNVSRENRARHSEALAVVGRQMRDDPDASPYDLALADPDIYDALGPRAVNSLESSWRARRNALGREEATGRKHDDARILLQAELDPHSVFGMDHAQYEMLRGQMHTFEGQQRIDRLHKKYVSDMQKAATDRPAFSESPAQEISRRLYDGGLLAVAPGGTGRTVRDIQITSFATAEYKAMLEGAQESKRMLGDTSPLSSKERGGVAGNLVRSVGIAQGRLRSAMAAGGDVYAYADEAYPGRPLRDLESIPTPVIEQARGMILSSNRVSGHATEIDDAAVALAAQMLQDRRLPDLWVFVTSGIGVEHVEE